MGRVVSITEPRTVGLLAEAFRERLLEEKEKKAMPKKREDIDLGSVEYKLKRPGKSKSGFPVHRVVLTGAFCQCTKCGGIKPMSSFGLRLEQGTIRNQSQCKDCR